MLLLLGGASRSGKSLLARRLLETHHIPFFSIDMLKMGLANGYPTLGIDPDAPSDLLGEQIAPIVRAICVNLLETNVLPYLIEGDSLLPSLAHDLQSIYPEQVKCCFLGYVQVDIELKLHQIRTLGGVYNDWTAEMSDDEIRGLIEEMQGLSRFLQDECLRLNLPYFETSQNFPQALEDAFQLLRP